MLQHGLMLNPGGDKTDDSIRQTDAFLNNCRPPRLVKGGVDRMRNNYCYLAHGDYIIDITSGEEKPVLAFTNERPQALLQIDVNPTACYVSDLDLYDQVKQLLQNDDQPSAQRLAHVYWEALQLLGTYRGNIHRPEVMTTYDVPPSAIKKIG